MTKGRLEGCTPAERRFVRGLSKMTDDELKAEWEKLNKASVKTASKKNWYIAERKEIFAGLELLDRGFTKKMVWVKG